MTISSVARSISICVRRSNIRDWLIRRIIYFSPISRIRCRNGCRSLSCGYHAAIMRQSRYSDHAGSRSGWYAHRFEPVQKKKITSRTRSRNRAEEGQEGIPGYPHKESADHHPYNPPRKRNSPPLLLFYSLSQKFFLTKNSCSRMTYTEVRNDK